MAKPSLHKEELTSEQIARAICNYLQDAVGDAAQAAVENPDFDKPTRAKIIRLKHRNVQDLVGALADEFFCDSRVMEDLAGDKLSDFCGKDTHLRQQVLNDLERIGHSALKVAALKMRKNLALQTKD